MFRFGKKYIIGVSPFPGFSTFYFIRPDEYCKPDLTPRQHCARLSHSFITMFSILLLLLLVHRLSALFTPRSRAEFQKGKVACLKEDATGHCPVFAEQATPDGQGTGNNGLLPQWDVSNVDAMSSCFRGDKQFQQNLENWTVTQLRNANEMFYNCEDFDGQGLANWNVENLQIATYMFSGATNFVEDLSKWNVKSLTNVKAMFGRAEKMNFNVGKWGRTMPTPGPTTLEKTFHNARSFQGVGIETWSVTSVTSMLQTFDGASRFNGDIR